MEDLTLEQLDTLRELLEALDASLHDQLRAATESAKPVELDQAALGRVTRGDAMQAQQMAAASRRSLQSRVLQVQVARAALAAGNYGECRRCEEPIGFKRLSVRPEAPFCLTCQSQSERR